MRFYPTRIQTAFPCFIFISILFILSCSKDSDLLLDSIIDESTLSLEERENNTTQEENKGEESVEESDTITEDIAADTAESRTTSFSPTNDAHFQSGKGYNQNIVRLEEGSRTSYLMFDMSPIETIGGTISKVTLQFTINSDDGNGNISVYKGKSSNWTEESLSDSNIPEIDTQIGSITKEYKIGATEIIDLESSSIIPEVMTLVLDHKNGNDLAFASKEHVSKIGPKLVVTYSVPVGTEDIVITEEETTTQEETTEEEETNEAESTNEAPIAIADATPPSGGVPLEVSFTGSNSSDDTGITSYQWDFKDGSGASVADAQHTFTTAGIYKVTLTVKDAKGLSNTDEVIITVTEKENEAPKAVVSATPISGEAPLAVSFKGSASTDDNSIASYGWDFKDGSKTNQADFTYTYTEPGLYEAELTVKDENGLEDTEIITITVIEPKNEAPVAVLSANPTSGTAPLNVQFIGDKSTDDIEITNYSWDFKDGGTASTPKPSHEFTEEGTYQVELTVKDKQGLSDKKTITITVTAPQNQPPVAKITANPTSGVAPLEVQFIGHNSTDDKAITSYLWNFKDGTTATNMNPSHAFTEAGTYTVDFTVKDAEGASSSESVTISVTEPINDVAPPGFYVSTSGNASNDGKSPSKPWSLEHAFLTAQPGDIVYIKAGTYSNKQVVNYRDGNSGNKIKFIGYKNTPGDLSSNFEYGDALNANNMPLLKGSSSNSGTAIDINGNYVELHNLQITNYELGLNTKGSNVILKNIVISNIGEQSNNSQQNGKGIHVYGNNSIVEDCFVLNANSEGINLKGTSGSTVKNSKVYSNNTKNPTGYYILISGNGKNNTIEDCIAYRDINADLHQGHGILVKDMGSYNIIKRCKTYNTGYEVNFDGVSYNTFQDSYIYGNYSKKNNQYTCNIAIKNGAHDNTFKNIYIEDSSAAIKFHDFDDGFNGSGVDKMEGGHNNKFINVEVNKAKNIIGATSPEVGAAAFSKNNEFRDCTFDDISSFPFFSYQKVSDTKFINCSFSKIPSKTMLYVDNGGSFQMSFTNCSFIDVGFPKP